MSDRAQLAYASREGRALTTANVVDFIRLAHDAVATNTEHAGIGLVPSRFRGDEFRAIADAIVEALKRIQDSPASSSTSSGINSTEGAMGTDRHMSLTCGLLDEAGAIPWTFRAPR
jgi:hypothetical protein